MFDLVVWLVLLEVLKESCVSRWVVCVKFVEGFCLRFDEEFCCRVLRLFLMLLIVFWKVFRVKVIIKVCCFIGWVLVLFVFLIYFCLLMILVKMLFMVLRMLNFGEVFILLLFLLFLKFVIKFFFCIMGDIIICWLLKVEILIIFCDGEWFNFLDFSFLSVSRRNIFFRDFFINFFCIVFFWNDVGVLIYLEFIVMKFLLLFGVKVVVDLIFIIDVIVLIDRNLSNFGFWIDYFDEIFF